MPHGRPTRRRPQCFAGSRLSERLDKAPVDMFLYRLYDMYLAVLAERTALCSDGQDVPGGGLLPRAL